MRKVYLALEARKEELGGLLEQGLRYYRTLHCRHSEEGALYSWQKTFPSASRSEVETRLAGLGYSTEWTDQGALRWPWRRYGV